MQRTIIRIDESKCDGCGYCVVACHEGAIDLVDGKARLVSETYCDGLGACLGECPQGAITLGVEEAQAFQGPAPGSPAARSVGNALPAGSAIPGPAGGHTVRAGSGGARERFEQALARAPVPSMEERAPAGGCPGSAVRQLVPATTPVAACPVPPPLGADAPGPEVSSGSMLSHWPVQLMLVPTGAPFLRGADLVICADCVPFAVADFHARYLAGRAIVVGCPKLDDLGLYRDKLKALLAQSGPASLTVVRMEVPCCGGIAAAVVEARDVSAPRLPVEIHTVGFGGRIVREVRPPAAWSHPEAGPEGVPSASR